MQVPSFFYWLVFSPTGTGLLRYLCLVRTPTTKKKVTMFLFDDLLPLPELRPLLVEEALLLLKVTHF